VLPSKEDALIVDDIRVFIPSKNFDESNEFYCDLGFTADYVTDNLSIFENGECSFFLQRFYNKDLAENLMLQICVLNIESAFQKASSARHKVKITPIETQPWGKVFYVWGPAGELLHVTQLGG
jgi:catechol 2,3-dioxygenase-like lactoylglutathione lyase family enzyme